MRRTKCALVLVFLVALPTFAITPAFTPPAKTLGAPSPGAAPATTDNDNTCDIGTFPAATLLLPYFEVDLADPLGTTTLFTITNVTRLPQIAHITVWTDLSFPILDFNVFLTGYDVQSINMRQVLQGIVAPAPSGSNIPPGTSATNRQQSPLPTTGQPGAIPSPITSNPNLNPTALGAGGSCSQLPGILPPALVPGVVQALTIGRFNTGFPGIGCGTRQVGLTHEHAIGYLTIDVTSTCSVNLADNPIYFQTEILFDNVLTGDYMQVMGNPSTGNFAQASPMVHIRAIPEGGIAGFPMATNLPHTFYSRYTGLIFPTMDRRQPLPSVFAARWIQGGSAALVTDYKIWREGVTLGTQACSTAIFNAELPVTSIIRFDERENSFGYEPGTICSPCPEDSIGFPETSLNNVDDGLFPIAGSGDVGGWTYLNLDHGDFIPERPSQNWVIVSMYAQGRFAVDFDATMLGNGCTPSQPITSASTPIGPAPNPNP